MSVISCPTCDESVATWSSLVDHFWSNHVQIDKESDSRSCPTCDFPLKRENILFHMACLTDVEPGTVWTGLDTSASGSLCPICGKTLPINQELRHFQSHSEKDQKELLGGELSCSVCGEQPHPEGQFAGHTDCLVHHISISEEGEYSCPICSDQVAHEGALEWHIWLTHFEADGFHATCPKCDEALQYGELKQHLLCYDDFHGPDAARLFDLRIEDCFLCDVSVLNPHVLQRHMTGKHISQVQNIKGECKVCGEPINDNQVALHYPCLAAANNTNIKPQYRYTWRCPICNKVTNSQSNFCAHLDERHDLSLFSSDSCRICGDVVTATTDHNRCIEVLLGETADERVDSLRLPPVLDHKPQIVTYEPETSFDDSDIRPYYRELMSFVEQEKQSASSEAWRRYETVPLTQLKYTESVILDLVVVGTQNHPDHDLQIVFQRPTPEDEDDPDDLTTRFGIFPRQRVIVGADTDAAGLPMEAIVTFVDDQAIGIAPDPVKSYRGSVLQSALTQEDTVYHLVDLLTPVPYNRKQDAIERVQATTSTNGLVTGNTAIHERPRDIGTFYDGTLNKQQRKAVGRALGEPTLSCIHGPPGTGKTRTLTAAIKLAAARGDRVLACAHSNQAVDNLLVGSSTVEVPEDETLHSFVAAESEVKMSRVGSHSGNPVVQRHYEKVSQASANIVGATTSAAADLDIGTFDLVIVDEATQADQPSTFIPLLRGTNVVLAGDHKQLPPFCSNETAREEEMHISLFEHFQKLYGEQLSTKLIRQYRMNEEIARFPSIQFYDGELEHGETNRDKKINDLKPIVGHHVKGNEQLEDQTKSKYNIEESQLVASQVRLLEMNGVSASNIGIITAYSAQIGKIANALSREKINNPEDVTIDTIDSFQGAERDAIIVSFVRSNKRHTSGFLEFPDEGKRRLNVALTRAKQRLVVIGDFDTLGTISDHRTIDDSCAPVYQALHDYLANSERLRSHA